MYSFVLETFYGKGKFFMLYILSCLMGKYLITIYFSIGNILSAIANPYSLGVGSSGGIFGIFAVYTSFLI